MNQIISNGQQAVDIVIPGVAGTGQTKSDFGFGDLPYLRPNKAKIRAIEVFTVNDQSVSPRSQLALAPTAMMQRMTLDIYGGVYVPVNDNNGKPTGRMVMSPGTVLLRQIPILRFHQMQNAQEDPFNRNIEMFDDMEVDWTKSGINVTGAPGNVTDVCVLFNIYYQIINTLV